MHKCMTAHLPEETTHAICRQTLSRLLTACELVHPCMFVVHLGIHKHKCALSHTVQETYVTVHWRTGRLSASRLMMHSPCLMLWIITSMLDFVSAGFTDSEILSTLCFTKIIKIKTLFFFFAEHQNYRFCRLKYTDKINNKFQIKEYAKPNLDFRG